MSLETATGQENPIEGLSADEILFLESLVADFAMVLIQLDGRTINPIVREFDRGRSVVKLSFYDPGAKSNVVRELDAKEFIGKLAHNCVKNFIESLRS
ncbi:hypothetical protein KKC94_00265 [Patescibacteria group bacterium]|nr:hypothetical protein [Patescibacteria group bacterium]